MSKEMIISVNGREKKIAIVEDDVVTEFYVERGDENQGIVGNIYKGRVMKVLPGMQSAFVDIGLERDSFLYVSDFFDEEEEEEVEEKKETGRQAQKQPRAHREGLRIAPPVEQEPEEDKDLELRMDALRHIGEISVEPAIEPSPEEEGLEAADEAEPSLSPRQRRQRRLRYADKEAKAEKAPAAAETREAEIGADERVGEMERREIELLAGQILGPWLIERDHERRRGRHTFIHVARASAGRAARRTERPLRARGRRVRNGDRRPAVLRQDARRGLRALAQRSGAARQPSRPRPSSCRRRSLLSERERRL